MTEIKSLADELRQKINQPAGTKSKDAVVKKAKAEKPAKLEIPPILEIIRAYDTSGFKNMVHVRFDAQTAQTMNHLKMATGIDVSKVVAFSVHELLRQNPELKTIIKQFIQNLEL
ncbi:hypothetical protein [Mucilaginibacter sp. FT3.2]|uniref:hypothetical protein n=1 Tax=Mucilaginibacter sp. FT3.2 TaxID=2723090 RepID=UPI00160B1270|nr:hypothetical protein [Mucilaginibacter sp. FT3.2]MBB6234268.1 hypothetical protein [Mucilaginibacter sp. FT3.2]